GCLAEELMVVGDFRFDVIAGKRAGAKTVLLTNGGKSSMAPGDPIPDYVCGDLNEVVEIVLVTVTSL
ncbi:MAG: HAD family hydrolase, partial [Deltaproteobacteria bacterium]|nr:HAD family hydrolase [Deltaproteobacteria bacterium]